MTARVIDINSAGRTLIDMSSANWLRCDVLAFEECHFLLQLMNKMNVCEREL